MHNPIGPVVMHTGWMFIALALVGSPWAAAQERASFVPAEDHLTIRIDGQPFAGYFWRDRDVRRPFFANLHAPSGIQVTRNFPPLEGQDATDHATMHPSLWLAFGNISGADFWRNKGTVEHVEFTEKPTSSKGSAGFAVRNRYLAGDKTICEELCRIRIVPQPNATLLEWDSQFTGADDFYFGDQEEMGLGVRMATPLTVKNGGLIKNSDGLENESQVWGKPALWCDYSGTISGQQVGVLLMNDARNFRRPWFHARDYGLLVANPFGQNAFTGAAASKVAVPKGDTLRLRFGVLIHSGDVDRAAAYRRWQSGD